MNLFTPGLYIDFEKNSISAIHPKTFANTTLNHLSLANNLISTLSAIAWDNFQVPTITIILSNNLLTSIDSGSLSPLSKLGSLYLDSNQKASIGDSAFPSVQYLDISNNKLTHLNRVMFQGASIRTLILSNNSIDRIDTDTFHNLTGLYTLYLDANKIQEIQKDLFRNFSEVHWPPLLHGNMEQESGLRVRNENQENQSDQMKTLLLESS